MSDPTTEPVLSPVFEPPTWENEATDKGRADGCANTNIGPGRSAKESDVKPILPPAADVPRQTPITARMSRVDGCPECVMNAEPPREVKATADGWLAAYLCNDCGHAWLTSWKD